MLYQTLDTIRQANNAPTSIQRLSTILNSISSQAKYAKRRRIRGLIKQSLGNSTNLQDLQYNEAILQRIAIANNNAFLSTEVPMKYSKPRSKQRNLSSQSTNIHNNEIARNTSLTQLSNTKYNSNKQEIYSAYKRPSGDTSETLDELSKVVKRKKKLNVNEEKESVYHVKTGFIVADSKRTSKSIDVDVSDQSSLTEEPVENEGRVEE